MHVGATEQLLQDDETTWQSHCSLNAMMRLREAGMAIDDPRAAFEQQYLKEEEKSPVGIAAFTGKLAFPKAAFLFEIFQRVHDHFQKPSVAERISAMWQLLVAEVEHLESQIQDVNASKVSPDDLQESLQLAIRHDAEEFNDKKRERYVKLIGNSLRSTSKIDDLASFVQTVEQLGERDITVLKVLNLVMNKAGDWVDNLGKPVTKLHPNTFIQRRRELAVQIAKALGQKTDLSSQVTAGQTFSHEAGYEVCARLQGFGLSLEVDTGHREVPIGDYCFRPSIRGLMLLNLIGEEVPNLDKLQF
jgi:ribosomal 50S subunit-associated protein YjgA (DUF615 family)